MNKKLEELFEKMDENHKKAVKDFKEYNKVHTRMMVNIRRLSHLN